MKTGLVLEGGAMRGLFSAGVFDVWLEAGVEFDSIIGTSAGAAFGCNYKSKQVGRAVRYNKLMAHDKRYCSFMNLLREGNIFSAEFCYHYVPTQVDIFDGDAFAKNPCTFTVVCTDVETGEAVYKQLDKVDYDTLEWIRASASMPIASRVVELEGKKLLDGGVADSIPLVQSERMGCERNVVILTQPEGYVKHKNKLMPLMRIDLRKYPNMVEAIRTRHIMYNKQLEYVRQAEAAGTAFVVRPPSALPIGHLSHNPDEMQRVYDIGRELGKNTLEQVKRFVAQ